MRGLDYGDQQIGSREITYAVASMVIGLGILTLPRLLAMDTLNSDGWSSIAVGGFLAAFFTWVTAKLSARFPGQTFFQYSSKIVSRPVAYVLTLLFAIYVLLFVALEVRSLANVTEQYLFDRTPVEVIVLVFLWIVVYGVAGSRAAILRLNLMFLPIVLFVALMVVVMNVGFLEAKNFFPFFKTTVPHVFLGARDSVFAFLGFEILLFYVSMVKRPEKVPMAALKGILIPIVLYLIIYTSVIGVFGYKATSTILFPTVELAKEVQVPGEFFERFESFFFTVWIMTIFNTATMSFDVGIMALQSLFKKMKKHPALFLLSPLLYLVGMFPQNIDETFVFVRCISYAGVFFAVVLPSLLLIVAVLRGVKGDA